MAAPSLQQLTQSLTSLGLPAPSAAFLAPILNPASNSQRLPPLAALTATAKHRLLSSDLTLPNILDPTKAQPLPSRITDVTIPSRILPSDVPLQVLDIEDLSQSKWEQIEALESERRGETTKGREVIRVVAPPPDGEPASTAATQAPGSVVSEQGARNKSYGPFKLLLQDLKGQKVYGFELKRVEKIGYPGTRGGMSIGCKIMLKKGCRIARGMVLLEPGMVAVLGGRIEGLEKSWREGREKSLREAVGDGRRNVDGGNDPD